MRKEKLQSFVDKVKDNSGLKIVRFGGAIAASSGSLGLLINGLAERNSVKAIAGGSGLAYSVFQTGIEGKRVIQEATTVVRRGRS